MSSLPPPDPAPRKPGPDSFAARLKRKYGEDVDPGVSLDAASEAGAESPTSDLVQRLKGHSLELSRYKLQGEIARGGMGAILKIWDEDLRRHLAMKVILGKADTGSEGDTPDVDLNTLGRFLEEAQITSQLDHPGIVPVHELGLDSDGRVYFTMKLVKGRDLKTIFDLVFGEQEGWNETRALSVILKACEAIAYAHKKGVIHRDLKPGNVMVGGFGEVYVMDWGLARVLGSKDTHDIRIAPEFASRLVSVKTERRDEREELADSPIVTMDGDVMGTPAYMAPEQARGEVAKLGPRSDVYSMGALLYHLLARQVPYVPRGARLSNRTVLGLVVNGPPPALSVLRKDVPAELTAIVAKAMARKAAQRYPDTLALAEDLRAFLENRVVGAYEAGAWAEARKWVRRNRPFAASIAAGLLIAIGGLAWVSLVQSLARERMTAKNTELAAAITAAQESEKQVTMKNTELAAAVTTAQESQKLAKVQEASARTEKVNVLKLSAIQTLEDLTKEADDLWPAEPGLVPRYREWMGKAEKLVARLPEFRASLAEIEKRALAAGDARLEKPAQPLAGRETESSKKREWRFADDGAGGETGDRWWHEQMVKLVTALESFQDPKTGLMRGGVSAVHGWSVTQRLEFAASVAERTVDGAEAKRLWSAAIAAIAASPKYGGLKLTPQIGLLPIGADPDSGLWEFAHAQSGRPPERAADRRLIPAENMGFVFVLIPGGTFWMGAQKADPNGRNYDPSAEDTESPLHEVTLSPYFLSKYEMTQGQWERLTGENPSFPKRDEYSPIWNKAGKPFSTLFPVTNVSWPQCTEVLGRLRCELPTEAQWENGCRGGTSSVYWNGSQLEVLGEVANVADAYASKHDNRGIPEFSMEVDDGNTFSAEVGSYRANAYGLHDVHGNVWEFCRDNWIPYAAGKQVDPVIMDTRQFIISRGGCFGEIARLARAAFRNHAIKEFSALDQGLRPARSVMP